MLNVQLFYKIINQKPSVLNYKWCSYDYNFSISFHIISITQNLLDSSYNTLLKSLKRILT